MSQEDTSLQQTHRVPRWASPSDGPCYGIAFLPETGLVERVAGLPGVTGGTNWSPRCTGCPPENPCTSARWSSGHVASSSRRSSIWNATIGCGSNTREKESHIEAAGESRNSFKPWRCVGVKSGQICGDWVHLPTFHHSTPPRSGCPPVTQRSVGLPEVQNPRVSVSHTTVSP